VSLSSFLFTITNPHDLPPQIFKQREAANAIFDWPTCGPAFGSQCDLYVSNECHTSRKSYSFLGDVYANDTRFSGSVVLTGAKNFTVEEIEVFEVI
jgi:hypothetical protein